MEAGSAPAPAVSDSGGLLDDIREAANQRARAQKALRHAAEDLRSLLAEAAQQGFEPHEVHAAILGHAAPAPGALRIVREAGAREDLAHPTAGS